MDEATQRAFERLHDRLDGIADKLTKLSEELGRHDERIKSLEGMKKWVLSLAGGIALLVAKALFDMIHKPGS